MVARDRNTVRTGKLQACRPFRICRWSLPKLGNPPKINDDPSRLFFITALWTWSSTDHVRAQTQPSAMVYVHESGCIQSHMQVCLGGLLPRSCMCIQLRCIDWKASELLDWEVAMQEGDGQILRPAT